MTTESTETKNRRKGFAAFTPEQRREYSSRGGKAAHAAGTAHEFTHDEAVAAGKLGGLAQAAKRRAKEQP